MAVPALFALPGPGKKLHPKLTGSGATLAKVFPHSRVLTRDIFRFLGTFPGLSRPARWETLPGAGLLQGIPKGPVSPVPDEETVLFLSGNRNYWGEKLGVCLSNRLIIIMTAETLRKG